MEILLANPRGFCAGVDRAIDIVERAIELFGAPIYVRHEVVHNRYVVERLRNLGAPDALVEVTGNLKFDVALPAHLLDEGRQLRDRWGRDRPVWIAASTHRGEERKVLDAYERLRHHFPRLLLVLVPRHPERFQAVARLCVRRGFRIALRSRARDALPANCEVLVGDTMGELQRLYAAADVAFIASRSEPRSGSGSR